MIRRIIHIDQDKCNGCGACARACHEGAIDMVDGKAKLMREHSQHGIFLLLYSKDLGLFSHKII